MTPNKSTGYTPFFLVYGAEAILPSDLIHTSARVAAYIKEDAEISRQNDLDLVKEVRVFAKMRSIAYQQKLRKYHSQRVRSRSFNKVIWFSGLCNKESTNFSQYGKGPF